MAINAVQKHHLARTTLLIKQIWEWSILSVKDLADVNPGKIITTEVSFDFVPKGNKVTKKVQSDCDALRDKFIEVYREEVERIPGEGTIALAIALEVAQILLIGSISYYPPVKDSPDFNTLWMVLDQATTILESVLNDGEKTMVETASNSVYTALNERIVQLDCEESYWFNGKRYTRWEEFSKSGIDNALYGAIENRARRVDQ